MLDARRQRTRLCHKREPQHSRPDTWSPMLKDYSGEILSPTVGELVDYILVHSDNNASNMLFERIVATDETDSLIRIMLPQDDFKIVWKESHMKTDNDRSYDNRTSPLAYAALLNRVFTDSIVSPEKQEFIRAAMEKCRTGMSRIGADFPRAYISPTAQGQAMSTPAAKS